MDGSSVALIVPVSIIHSRILLARKYWKILSIVSWNPEKRAKFLLGLHQTNRSFIFFTFIQHRWLFQLHFDHTNPRMKFAPYVLRAFSLSLFHTHVEAECGLNWHGLNSLPVSRSSRFKPFEACNHDSVATSSRMESTSLCPLCVTWRAWEWLRWQNQRVFW